MGKEKNKIKSQTFPHSICRNSLKKNHRTNNKDLNYKACGRIICDLWGRNDILEHDKLITIKMINTFHQNKTLAYQKPLFKE